MPRISPAASLATAADRKVVPWVPEDNGWLASPADPAVVSATNILASGFVYLFRTWVPRTVTFSAVDFWISTAGSTLTANQSRVGIYSSGGTLLGQTADLSGTWNSTGLKTPALVAESGQSLTVDGGNGAWVYVGFLAVGTTPPTFRTTSVTSTLNTNLTGATGYRLALSAGSQTSLAASLGAVSPVASSFIIGFGLR